MPESIEPKREIAVADVRLTLLGTAHVSRASEEEVRTLLRAGSTTPLPWSSAAAVSRP
jgi:hypothetical protein